VIAATNRDLLGMVQERTFRADLYYRRNVFPITVAPLRERTEDIPLFAAHFVRMFVEQQGKVIDDIRDDIPDDIPDDILEALKHYHWPANIRELLWQPFARPVGLWADGMAPQPGSV
jgi:transcriptional regulator with GAF, ATPase, and Fis domain